MVKDPGHPDYRDRSTALACLGILLLLAGIGAGLLGPREMYCFHLFSPGGRFHYEGFGFGSFMFGNIAAQIIGYYLIAAVCIPLGYGHLKKRRWAGTLAQALLWSWLVVGAPVVVVVFFILAASKDLSPPAALAALVLLGLSYTVLPGLLIRFYRSRDVGRTLAAKDARPSRLEDLPMPLLVLACLYSFYFILLHVAILFNSVFPFFGAFRFGLRSLYFLDVSLAILACLVWGTLRRRPWAWWGSTVFLGALTLSTVLTFCRTDYAALLAGLAFPPREMEILRGLPIEGWHLALMAGLPLFVTWIVAVRSRRYFLAGGDVRHQR